MNMSKKPELSKELLEELLDYDPGTGKLVWKTRSVDLFPDERACKIWNTRYAGRLAGRVRTVKRAPNAILDIFGVRYSAPRVVWALSHGAFPKKQLRHLDGDATNNRVENLVEFGDNVEKPPKPHNYKATPPQELLLSLLDYNKDTGELKWKARPGCTVWNARWVGKVAGNISSTGYLRVKVAQPLFEAHRLIFKMVMGREPECQIDHINGDGLDNRWCNLREATKSQNMCNTRLPGKNTTGYKGVTTDKRQPLLPFYGRIVIKRKLYTTPSFATPEEVSTAVVKLRGKIHGQYANHG
jgi:hypothetical protein